MKNGIAMNAGQHQRDQQREHGEGAQPMWQHDHAKLLGETHREDQDRRHDQDHAERRHFSRRSLGCRAGGLRVQSRRDVGLDALDVGLVMMRQIAGPVVGPADLEEAEAHQARAERDRQVDEPHRRFEIVGLLAGLEHLRNKGGAEGGDHAREQRAAEQREQDDMLARMFGQAIDQQIDADMDAGAHAVGRAELRHPDEHVDAEFLRPGQIQLGQEGEHRHR